MKETEPSIFVAIIKEKNEPFRTIKIGRYTATRSYDVRKKVLKQYSALFRSMQTDSFILEIENEAKVKVRESKLPYLNNLEPL